MFRSKRPSSEALYRKGVQAWADRDLESAVEHLQASLEASSGPLEDGWWFSASRTLAHIAMEQGDLETAEQHLQTFSGDGVVDAMQHALRGRLALLAGDEPLARINVSVAVGTLFTDPEDDLGSLMNGAIALMWCGEVLVEMGYGREADRLTRLARERIERADVSDPGLQAGLTMVEIGAARLMGNIDRAVSLAEGVDQTLSPDFGFQVKTELARIAWTKGDTAEAIRLYSDAAGMCLEHKYPAQAERLGAESSAGPSPVKDDPMPVESWAGRSLEQLMSEHVPYAVVVRLPGEVEADHYLGFFDRVSAAIESDPTLGVIDGFATDGSVWELALDGDDPERLWAVVSGLLPDRLPAGGHAEIRDGGDRKTILLGE